MNDDKIANELEVEQMITKIIERKFYGHSKWSGWSQTIVTIITMVFLSGGAWQVLAQHTREIAEAKESDKTLLLRANKNQEDIHLLQLNQERYNSINSQILTTLGEMKSDLKETANVVQVQSKDIVQIKSKVEILTKE